MDTICQPHQQPPLTSSASTDHSTPMASTALMMFILLSRPKSLRCLQIHLRGATKNHHHHHLHRHHTSTSSLIMSASLGGSYHDSTDAASFATCHTAVSMLSRQHSFGMESSSIRARQTRLFSSSTPAPSNEGTSSTHQRKTPPTTPVTEVVGTRLSQAVQHETLTADEAQSISGVLFNPNFDPVFSLETTTPEDVTKVMNIAIESYAAQKLRRAESGRDAIGNVGFYVRSIVKKELEALNVSPQSGKKGLDSNAGVGNEEQKNANTSTATTEPITELLRFHNIQPNELNDNCMHALNQYSISTVKYALEAFSRQQT